MRRFLVPLILIALLGVINVQMWLGPGGVPKVSQLEDELAAQQAANRATKLKNQQLASEIDDLKNGLGMVEEKARMELGMVRPNEIFVQVTPAASSTVAHAPTEQKTGRVNSRATSRH